MANNLIMINSCQLLKTKGKNNLFSQKSHVFIKSYNKKKQKKKRVNIKVFVHRLKDNKKFCEIDMQKQHIFLNEK